MNDPVWLPEFPTLNVVDPISCTHTSPKFPPGSDDAITFTNVGVAPSPCVIVTVPPAPTKLFDPVFILPFRSVIVIGICGYITCILIYCC